jgi:hypothetical protein
VHWIVRVDPKGETSLMYVLPVCAALLLRVMQPRRCRCRHVSLVEKSNVKGEVEFLFAPFSRLHRCVSARARQAHRQQPHRHRALIRGLWFKIKKCDSNPIVIML